MNYLILRKIFQTFSLRCNPENEGKNWLKSSLTAYDSNDSAIVSLNKFTVLIQCDFA